MVCSAPLASKSQPPQCRCIWTAVYFPGRPSVIFILGGSSILTPIYHHKSWILYIAAAVCLISGKLWPTFISAAGISCQCYQCCWCDVMQWWLFQKAMTVLETIHKWGDFKKWKFYLNLHVNLCLIVQAEKTVVWSFLCIWLTLFELLIYISLLWNGLTTQLTRCWFPGTQWTCPAE